jgi:hypothetical protein
VSASGVHHQGHYLLDLTERKGKLTTQHKNMNTPTNSEALPLTNCSASWLPIETAPRDGTNIIVGFDSASVWIVHVAWWREMEDWMRNDPQWSEEDVGWWSYTKHSVTQEKLEDHRMPTHWMPLPSLPNA